MKGMVKSGIPTLLSLALFAPHPCSAEEAKVPGPVFKEKLVQQEAFTGPIFPYRDGVIIIGGEGAANDVMQANGDSETTRPAKVEGIDLLLEARQAGDAVVFLGVNGFGTEDEKILICREETDGKARMLPLESVFRMKQREDQSSNCPELMNTNHQAAVFFDETVWWFDEEWHHRKLPDPPKFHAEFQPKRSDLQRILLGTTLFTGWDRGEWGGALASINLAAEKPRWVEISGRKPGDRSGIHGDYPVVAITSPDGKNLWAATGLSHMMAGNCRGLYERKSKNEWKPWIDGAYDDDWGKFRLPVMSDILDITFDRDRQPFILAGSAGVFKITETALVPVIPYSFEEEGQPGFSPLRFAITANGDIYISTVGVGVLFFHKTGETWSARQIKVPASH